VARQRSQTGNRKLAIASRQSHVRFRSYLFLIGRHMAGAPLRSVVAVAGVAVAAAVWMAAVAAVWLVRVEIAPRIETIFPANRLVARPAAAPLLMFDIGPARLSEATARAIEGWPGVAAVARQAAITFPLRAEINLLGNALQTDAIVNGVDPSLVAAELPDPGAFAYSSDPAAPVPVVASRYFLDMYNLGYAESEGLPRVNESAVVGRHFQLILGESVSSGPREKKRIAQCRVVGLTRNVQLIGLVVPIEYAREWNAWHRGAGAASAREGYTALHVSVRSAEAYAEVESRLRAEGMQVESARDLLERARLMLALIVGGATAGGLLVVALAGFNLWNTFTLNLIQRRREIAVLRALGATPGQVFAVFGAEALALAAAGCALGGGAIATLVLAARGRLPDLPEAFDFLDGARFGAALGAAGATLPVVILAVCLFAAPQIARAARRPICEML